MLPSYYILKKVKNNKFECYTTDKYNKNDALDSFKLFINKQRYAQNKSTVDLLKIYSLVKLYEFSKTVIKSSIDADRRIK